MEIAEKYVSAARRAGACKTVRVGADFSSLSQIDLRWFERACPEMAKTGAGEVLAHGCIAVTGIPALSLLSDSGSGDGTGYGTGYGAGSGDGDGDGDGSGSGDGDGDGDGYGYGAGDGDGYGDGYGDGAGYGDGDQTETEG